MNNAAWAGHRQPHDEAIASPEVAIGNPRDFMALSILTKQELDTFTDDHDIATCTNVFRLLDVHIDERGFENVTVPLRYLYVKLVMALGTPIINDSTVFAHLAEKDRDALTHLFDRRTEKPAPTFSDVATFILGAAIEREGFTGFSGFERLGGSGRILMVASHREEKRVDQFIAPPAGLYRMASLLRIFGLEVHVVDPELDGVKKLELLASTVIHDAVMVSILQPTMAQMIKCMDMLRRCAGTRDALFIGGGQGATTSNRNFLLRETPLDLICARLGEFPALDCIVQLQDGEVRDIENIHGVYTLTAEHDVTLTPMDPYTLLDYRVISHTLDFGAIPYRKYWERNRLIYGEEFLQRTGTERLGFNTVRLYTELYCPYGCSFCTGPRFMTEGVTGHQKALLLPPDDIIRLIHRIRRAYPEVNHIYFGSDNFILDKKRIYVLCDLVESQLGDAGLGFSAITRLDIVDAILLHRLRQVGFQQLSYGIESTSERLHQDISKGLHPISDSAYAANALHGAEKLAHGYTPPEPIKTRIANDYVSDAPVSLAHVIKRAIRETIAADIRAEGTIILFYPESTKAELLCTIRNTTELINQGAVINTFTYAEPYKDTELEQRGYEYIEKTHHFDNREALTLPEYIQPVDATVRGIAHDALAQLDDIRVYIRNRHVYSGQWTRTLETLAIFYSTLSQTTESKDFLERTIARVVTRLKARHTVQQVTHSTIDRNE